ncbi:MAG: secondary thiamine-phosphate synthase enzyme YjbQ [Candidatus Eremiobacterota bacterium]
MKIFRKIKEVDTEKQEEIIDITDEINNFIKERGIKNGTLTVQTLHTTMGLIIQEITEPRLCRDIIVHLNKIVSQKIEDYEHNDIHKRPEVIDKENEPLNGKAHIQSLLLDNQLFLDICDGKLTLGKWQRVGLVELDGPREKRKYLLKSWEDSKTLVFSERNFNDAIYPVKKSFKMSKLMSGLRHF